MSPQVFILILSITASFLSASKAAPEGDLTFDCRKIMGKIMKMSIKQFGVCTKEVRANSTKEDFPNKMSCIMKCTFVKLDLLTDKGIVSKETIQMFMDKHIPAEAHELGHILAEECLESIGSKVDPNQPFCESYGEFSMCMQNSVGDFLEKANCKVGGFR